MKREIGKEVRIIIMIFVSIFVVVLITSTVSAGFFNDLKSKLTGKATQSVDLNITVGVPAIVTVFNDTIVVTSGPNEYPPTTDIIVNFSVDNSAGYEFLNDSTAKVNVTFAVTRTQSSCTRIQGAGNNANYSCNVTVWWFDATGTYNITAEIYDNSSNAAINTSTDFVLGERTAFTQSPASLAWPGLAPGDTNKTSNNDPLLLNNTGNDIIDAGNLKVNASDLRGESTPTERIFAANMSIHHATGGACSGAACTECGGSVMNRTVFNAVTGANLTAGNITINDGSIGQEELYFCIRILGSGLSEQSYSSANETEWSWIVQIT